MPGTCKGFHICFSLHRNRKTLYLIIQFSVIKEIKILAKENFKSIVPKGRIAISAMSLPFFCPLSKLMYEEEQSQGYNRRTM